MSAALAFLHTEQRDWENPAELASYHVIRDACVAGNGCAWLSYRFLRRHVKKGAPTEHRHRLKEAGLINWVAWPGPRGATVYWLPGRCKRSSLIRLLRQLGAPFRVLAEAASFFARDNAQRHVQSGSFGALRAPSGAAGAHEAPSESGSARCARSPDVLASPAEPTSAAGDASRTAQRPVGRSSRPPAAEPEVPRRVEVLPDGSPDLEPRPGERQAAYMSRLTELYERELVSPELYDQLWTAAAVDWRGPGP